MSARDLCLPQYIHCWLFPYFAENSTSLKSLKQFYLFEIDKFSLVYKQSTLMYYTLSAN